MTALHPRVGRRRVRGLPDFYATVMRVAVIEQFQYRGANYAYMIGMIAEPVIYLVVWTAVADAQGGSIRGLSTADLAGYYVVWTLVRNMNIVFTPYGWEERIREGQLSGQLLRPVHPLHYDLAFFAGWKLVVIVLWLPIAAVMWLVFHPALEVTPLRLVAFFLAIWGAYLIRSMVLWVLGMVTFWTTRVGALYQLFFTAELLLSGRLVPMALMPLWVRQVAACTPFPLTFGFPIQTLTTGLDRTGLLVGLGLQVVWIGVSTLLVVVVWRLALRRYAAVGG